MNTFDIPSAAEFCAQLQTNERINRIVGEQPISTKEMTTRIAEERRDIANAFKSHMLFWEKKEVKEEQAEPQQCNLFNFFFKPPKPDKASSRLVVKVELEDSMTPETEQYMQSLNYKIVPYRFNHMTGDWEYFVTPNLK